MVTQRADKQPVQADSTALREVAEELRQLVDNLLDTIKEDHPQSHRFK
tara:strand:+ start:367 stop:510 length:144 start_codon:yes stop_codon:yes gene_type:complete